MSRRLLALGLAVGWLLAAASPAAVAQAERPAKPGGSLGPSQAAILGDRGVCVFLGDKGCKNAIALARKTEWRVYPRPLALHQIRASTAFFNSDEEIDRLVQAVRAYAEKSR